MTASFSKGRMLISKVKLSFWYYMIKLLFVFSLMHFCGVCFSHDLFSSEMACTLSIGYVSFAFYDHSWILSYMKLRTHCWRSIPGTHPRPEKYPLWGWGGGGWHILISQEEGMKLSISRPSRPCPCVSSFG